MCGTSKLTPRDAVQAAIAPKKSSVIPQKPACAHANSTFHEKWYALQKYKDFFNLFAISRCFANYRMNAKYMWD